MAIRKFSEFNQSKNEYFTKVENEVIENEIVESEENITNEVETIKEEVLLDPKNNVSIEILEDHIIKFNDIHLNDILETLKAKYSDTDYYIRKKDNQLHVVKYNEKLKLNINEFVNSLLKFYSIKPETRKIVEGIKVKGNQNFSIIENMKFTDKFVDDITKLLAKKNKE